MPKHKSLYSLATHYRLLSRLYALISFLVSKLSRCKSKMRRSYCSSCWTGLFKTTVGTSTCQVKISKGLDIFDLTTDVTLDADSID